MALGASVAVALPTIEAGNAADSMTPVTLTGLQWVTTDGLSAPSTDGTVANISTLNFTFADAQGITGAGDSATSSYTTTIGAQDNNHFKFTSTQGLKMGDGTGTLNVHMGVMGTTRSFTLNLGKNTAGYSLMGNLTLFAGKDNGKFDATFQGSVKGNITIDSDGNHQNVNEEPHSFTFEDGANLEGDIQAGYGKNIFIFNGTHTLKNIVVQNGNKVPGMNANMMPSITLQIADNANLTIDKLQSLTGSPLFPSKIAFKGFNGDAINNANITIKHFGLDVGYNSHNNGPSNIDTILTLNGGSFRADKITIDKPNLTLTVNNGLFEVGNGGISTKYSNNTFKAQKVSIGGDVIVDHSNGTAGSVSITADQSLMINGAIKNDQGGVNITIGGNNQSNRIANGILLNHNGKDNTGTKTITLKQTGASKTTIGTLKNADGSDSGLSLKIVVGKADITLAPSSELILEGGVFVGGAYGSSFNVNGAQSKLSIKKGGITGGGGAFNTDDNIVINVGSLDIAGDLQNPSTTARGKFDITLNGGTSSIGGNILAKGTHPKDGGFNTVKANFTLNNDVSLSLGGASNTIGTFTATGNANTLTITNTTAGTNTITTLNLGNQANTKGFLTIDNSSSKVLTITNFASQDVNNTLTINKGAVEITNNVTANANFTLNNDASLDLKGVSNTIGAFTATGNNNALTIANGTTTNSISTLTLGAKATAGANATPAKDGTLNLSTANTLTIDNLSVANKSGTLNIAQDSKGVVTINTATLNGGKTLKLNDDRNSATLAINTFNTQGAGNQIYFHKDLKINTLSESAGTTKDSTSLTFVNKITKNTKDPNNITYTAGRLVISGSNNGSTNNAQLNGTYKMAIRNGGNINPEEIIYDEASKTGIKVATIKKYDGVTSGSTEQADLRSQGVIDLGEETDMTLRNDLSLVSLKYYVAETDISGNSQQGNNNYITYFLNGQGAVRSEIRESILSNLALSSTELYLANFNSLNRRMGELRDNAHSQGAWGRIFNGMQSNDVNLKSSTIYTTVQAGYDYGFGLGEGATNYLGFALSYGHSESEFKSKARFGGNFASIDSLKSDLVEVALYNSYVEDSGWHNDTVAKFSYLFNKVGISGSGITNKGDINTYALTLSDEFGYRIKLGTSDEWYIDPQAELGFGYFNGKEFNFSEVKLGTMDSLFILRSRLGATFGYDFRNFTSKENGLSAKLYLGLFSEIDHFSGGDVKFGSESAQWDINTDARAVLNIGTNLEVKDNTRIYVDFESSFGGKITTDYKINAGVRYSFGEKMDFSDLKDIKPLQTKSAPMKLKEEASTQPAQTENQVSEEVTNKVETANQEQTSEVTSNQQTDEAK